MDDSELLIVLIFNLDKEICKGDPDELAAIQDTAKTAEYLYQAILKLGYRIEKIETGSSLNTFREVMNRFPTKSTLVFNNCDGFRGENLGSVKIARVLESMNFKHTGAPSNVIYDCISKSRAKTRLVRNKVPTPRFQIFKQTGSECRLSFPMIIKPVAEDASMGIELDSVVTTERDLFERIAYINTVYDEPAIVEEYIVGREFAVAMWGNDPVEVLPVAEEDFGHIDDPLKAFLTYEAKWIEDSYYFKEINSRPAVLAAEMDQKIRETAINAFHAMGLRDIGRVDIRYKDDVPYVIDVNELPDLSPESGFPRTVRAAGYTYESMVEKILDIALRREGLRK